MNCYVSRKSDGISIRFDYRKSTLSEGTVTTILNKYHKVLKQIADNIYQGVSKIETVEQIALPVIQDATWYKSNLSIEDVVYSQFKKFEDRVAVISGDMCYTYKHLNSITNCWAKLILELTEVKCPVGFCVSHNINMVTAVISILKSCNPYVALDPNYPHEQLRDMVIESGARIILTDSKNRHVIEKNQDIYLDFILC